MNFETPAQLAKRVGVPVANIRHLIHDGLLDHIFLTPGKRNPKIPVDAWDKYLKNFTIRAANNSDCSKQESSNQQRGDAPMS